MENAPAILLFWFFGIIIFIAAIALLIAGMIFIKKGNKKGKICLIGGIICAVPVVLVSGYILYLWL